MDESKLLEECINIKLTPLQTVVLSKTVVVVDAIISFLIDNNCMVIARVTEDNVLAPDSEQTGSILVKSALTALQEIRTKIWESGKEEIGEVIPEEFNEIIDTYSTIMNQIAYNFVESLRERGI